MKRTSYISIKCWWCPFSTRATWICIVHFYYLTEITVCW